MASPAVLTAALTGPIATKADNPALPVSPEEIAADARAAWEAGAGVVHVHLRDAEGRPTADLGIAQRVVGLIEEACPALIQLSTGMGLGRSSSSTTRDTSSGARPPRRGPARGAAPVLPGPRRPRRELRLAVPAVSRRVGPGLRPHRPA